MYGCIAGIGASAIVTIAISTFKDANYQWESLAAVRILTDKGDQVDVSFEDPSYDPERLRKAAYFARAVTAFLFLALFIVWPLS